MDTATGAPTGTVLRLDDTDVACGPDIETVIAGLAGTHPKVASWVVDTYGDQLYTGAVWMFDEVADVLESKGRLLAATHDVDVDIPGVSALNLVRAAHTVRRLTAHDQCACSTGRIEAFAARVAATCATRHGPTALYALYERDVACPIWSGQSMDFVAMLEHATSASPYTITVTLPGTSGGTGTVQLDETRYRLMVVTDDDRCALAHQLRRNAGDGTFTLYPLADLVIARPAEAALAHNLLDSPAQLTLEPGHVEPARNLDPEHLLGLVVDACDTVGDDAVRVAARLAARWDRPLTDLLAAADASLV